MSVEFELIEQEELLEGIMLLTNNNLGLSHQLLEQVIKKTTSEVQKILKELEKNIDVEKRRAKRKANRTINKNMRLSANHPTKPLFTAAHHLVAWNDPRAEKALRILMKWGISPHNEVNSVYLPLHEKHTPHKDIPNAIAHSKIHTGFYHINVTTVLVTVDIPSATRDDIIEALREIAEDLQDGSFPINDPIVLG